MAVRAARASRTSSSTRASRASGSSQSQGGLPWEASSRVSDARTVAARVGAVWDSTPKSLRMAARSWVTVSWVATES